ncbi:MAG TPA: hypothetical protein VMN60_05025 [Longimicrobiales bacterium]|nr:hypothetical protein [Longimicrobiales bacterium]
MHSDVTIRRSRPDHAHGDPVIARCSILIAPPCSLRMAVPATAQVAGANLTTAVHGSQTLPAKQAHAHAGVSTVNLTAIPDKGYRFARWSRGTCANASTQNPAIVTNTRVNTTCVADFVAETA